MRRRWNKKFMAGKKKEKKKFIANGIEFDSREETDFYHWCIEAEAHGYIKDFHYHTEYFTLCERASIKGKEVLKTKVKIVDKFLLHPHIYTPDFIIFPALKFNELEHGLKGSEKIYIDVKGGSDIYHNEREFSINQKWVYSKYQIFINKVIPEIFFKKTWCPVAALYHKRTGEILKKYQGLKQISQMQNTQLVLEF
ncbi:MAG: hypothetical protein A2017_18175 [Lentisphaerae bacterium GWF2_44_16]|nr:MAG: hypothetical protein A2017_18175 [Lentisphaerae bacterium GWF2_44_16]